VSTQEHLTRAADKTGVLGAILAAMGCAACFPALGSLAAALGLGFLSQYEGPFIRYVLPLFALIGLFANVIAHVPRDHRPPASASRRFSDVPLRNSGGMAALPGPAADDSCVRVGYGLFARKTP
jgi:hypothetical protein